MHLHFSLFPIMTEYHFHEQWYTCDVCWFAVILPTFPCLITSRAFLWLFLLLPWWCWALRGFLHITLSRDGPHCYVCGIASLDVTLAWWELRDRQAWGHAGCKDVPPPLPSTPTAASDVAGTGSLKKHPTVLITGLTWAPNPLPVISIISHPPSGLVAKSATEPLESDLMKAFYSNRMKCQLDASSRDCCHD